MNKDGTCAAMQHNRLRCKAMARGDCPSCNMPECGHHRAQNIRWRTERGTSTQCPPSHERWRIENAPR